MKIKRKLNLQDRIPETVPVLRMEILRKANQKKNNWVKAPLYLILKVRDQEANLPNKKMVENNSPNQEKRVQVEVKKKIIEEVQRV